MVSKDIIEGITFVQEYMINHDVSVVAVHNNEVICFRSEQDFIEFFDFIKEIDSDYFNCFIGIKFLGKPEALLLRYINVKGVYIQKGTMKGIATLIVGNIPHQIDMLIKMDQKSIFDDRQEDLRKIVYYIDDPLKAYDLLNEKILHRLIHSH